MDDKDIIIIRTEKSKQVPKGSIYNHCSIYNDWRAKDAQGLTIGIVTKLTAIKCTNLFEIKKKS